MGERIVEQSLDERRLLRPCGKKGVYACRKIDLGITVYIIHYVKIIITYIMANQRRQYIK